MPKKKGKSVSFDAMVKYFIKNYNIPTKKDIDRIDSRLDRLEQLFSAICEGESNTSAASKKKSSSSETQYGMTASETVLEVIRSFDRGVKFSDIQEKTGFEEKKLRNIIFRLNDLGRIKRIRRGVYTVS